MPIFEVSVKGSDKPRLVKAGSAAAARAHVADAKAINAERMSDLIEAGITMEKAGEIPTDPPETKGEAGKGDDSSNGNEED